MDSHLRMLASRQANVVAAWQLRNAKWSKAKIKHHLHSRGWHVLYDGVYLLASSAPDRRQLWFGAALTSPDSVLSHGSAGACYGFYRFNRDYEVVTRPGQGGRRKHGSLLVFRSKVLTGNVTTRDGIPITTAAKTLLDLAPGLNEKRLGRAFRESIRLKSTTAHHVLVVAQRHTNLPGAPSLKALATRYAALPYRRCRSDAEARGLEILHDSGVPSPRVNMKIAGEEADLTHPDRKLIVEIDGPQFHQFRDEDARKEQLWLKAGYMVRRISSDAVYDAPDELLALYAG